MIHFDKVSKRYSDRDISLHDISFRVSPGEFVSITGHSGAGKSTLLRLLIAQESPTEGSIYFDTVDVHGLHRWEVSKLRRRIGVVFQDYKLLPNKTAYENVAFAMEAAGRPDHEIVTDVPHILDIVNLSDKQHRFPHQLSGGEKQRVAIARAIINQPDVIIADEPTGNLDEQSAFEVIEILQKINDLGTTVLLTTHNKDIIEALKNRVITLEGGRITKDSLK